MIPPGFDFAMWHMLLLFLIITKQKNKYYIYSHNSRARPITTIKTTIITRREIILK